MISETTDEVKPDPKYWLYLPINGNDDVTAATPFNRNAWLSANNTVDNLHEMLAGDDDVTLTGGVTNYQQASMAWESHLISLPPPCPHQSWWNGDVTVPPF